MILYHISDREIQQPDIHAGRKNADFGQGFYLTPDREFTYRWARRDAVVNMYELDEAGLDIRRFSRSTAPVPPVGADHRPGRADAAGGAGGVSGPVRRGNGKAGRRAGGAPLTRRICESGRKPDFPVAGEGLS